MSDRRILIAGLGNPGSRYAMNRHNIGFMAIDAMARRHDATPWRARFQGLAAEAEIGGERALLLKPQTYMNDSGLSVGAAAKFFRIPLADLVVFHDEIDLGAARLKMKTGGGDAGHNGLRSITAHLGGGYRRARMGVGHPGDKALVHIHVLNDFAKAEAGWVEAMCDACAALAPRLAKGEDARFQNDVALAMQKAGFGEPKKPGPSAD
jgi:PTH1 family peptidyl-tRNA hydrolase